MALIKQIVLQRPGFAGQLTASAYWRVSSIQGGKATIHVVFEALVSGARVDETQFAFEPDLSPEAPNFIAQAYQQAKLLDRFAGSIDA